MSRRSKTPDVSWYAPGIDRPIARSTVAESLLLGILADDGMTFSRALTTSYLSPGEKAVLQAYISRGHGDTLMADLGVRS